MNLTGQKEGVFCMSDNLAYRDDFREKVREELIGGEVFLMAPASTNHVLAGAALWN